MAELHGTRQIAKTTGSGGLIHAIDYSCRWIKAFKPPPPRPTPPRPFAASSQWIATLNSSQHIRICQSFHKFPETFTNFGKTHVAHQDAVIGEAEGRQTVPSKRPQLEEISRYEIIMFIPSCSFVLSHSSPPGVFSPPGQPAKRGGGGVSVGPHKMVEMMPGRGHEGVVAHSKHAF